jgi:carboxylesterase type B
MTSDSPFLSIGGHGVIRGTTIRDSVTGKPKAHRYAGVPYALPPLGARRFTKPQPLPADFQYSSTGRSEFSAFAPACHQPTNYKAKSIEGEPEPPQTEDCLYLNIWTPIAEPPAQGWPILFSIHGGWLQIGSAHQDPNADYSNLLAPRDEGGAGFECIVVSPAYRLNVFGFLASDELDAKPGKANFGFWDQRLALEWTVKNARSLKANADQITVTGISAGAQSAHAQVLYEFCRARVDPSYRPHIKRCVFRSGSAMLPCKTLDEIAPQIVEMCIRLGLDADNDLQRIEALRKVAALELVAVIPDMKMHTFRAVQDGGVAHGGFVDSDWGERMKDGTFAAWCNAENISFAFGELSDEAQEYRLINAPSAHPLKQDLFVQLHNYYPSAVVEHLMASYDIPEDAVKDPGIWADTFGLITADAQIYTAQRLLESYLRSLPPSRVLRYRIERRAALVDDSHPKEKGVFHGTDGVIFGFPREVLMLATNQEEAKKDVEIFQEWLAPFKPWMEGKNNDIGQGVEGKMRVLRKDGSIEVIGDPLASAKEPYVEALAEAISRAPKQSHP